MIDPSVMSTVNGSPIVVAASVAVFVSTLVVTRRDIPDEPVKHPVRHMWCDGPSAPAVAD